VAVGALFATSPDCHNPTSYHNTPGSCMCKFLPNLAYTFFGAPHSATIKDTRIALTAELAGLAVPPSKPCCIYIK
jgi:hypothetical protein